MRAAMRLVVLVGGTGALSLSQRVTSLKVRYNCAVRRVCQLHRSERYTNFNYAPLIGQFPRRSCTMSRGRERNGGVRRQER